MTELPRRVSRAASQYEGVMAETIVEVRRVGHWLRVAAVDPDTGLEATAMGPVSAGEESLTRLALGKLARLLRAVPA